MSEKRKISTSVRKLIKEKELCEFLNKLNDEEKFREYINTRFGITHIWGIGSLTTGNEKLTENELIHMLSYILAKFCNNTQSIIKDSGNKKQYEGKCIKYKGIIYNFNSPEQLHSQLERAFYETNFTKAYVRNKLIGELIYDWCESEKINITFDRNGLLNIFGVKEKNSKPVSIDLLLKDNKLISDYLFGLNEYFVYPNYRQKHLSIKTEELCTGWNLKNIIKHRHIESESTEERKEEYYEFFGKLSKDIISKAMKHPLYGYLFKEPEKHRKDIRELLKATVSATDAENITVAPPVGGLKNYVENYFTDNVGKKYNFSAYDLMYALGKIAEKCSCADNEEYSISHNGIKKICSEISSEDTESLMHKCKNGGWLEYTESGYKFITKTYRLLFLSVYSARKFNLSEAPLDVTVSEIIDMIFTYIPQYDSNNLVRVDDRYDDTVFFTSGLLLQLDERLKRRILQCMIEKSSDFSVKERSNQIGCIYILSYLLCEMPLMSNKTRGELFKATYGRTMYRLQYNEWLYIKSLSPFYAETAKKQLLSALETENGYIKEQPYFLLLLGLLPQSDMFPDKLYAAALLQKTTWVDIHSENQLGNIRKKIFSLLDSIDFSVSNEINSQSICDALTVHLLMYALSNTLEAFPGSAGDFSSELLRGDYGKNAEQILLKKAIFADYIIRRSNPIYCERYIYGDKDYSEEMYVPCGVYRICCSLSTLKNTGKFHSPLSVDENIFYSKCFVNEDYRYKFLMAAMLSYTDFFENADADVMDSLNNTLDSLSPDEFIPYDHVDLTSERLKKLKF